MYLRFHESGYKNTTAQATLSQLYFSVHVCDILFLLMHTFLCMMFSNQDFKYNIHNSRTHMILYIKHNIYSIYIYTHTNENILLFSHKQHIYIYIYIYKKKNFIFFFMLQRFLQYLLHNLIYSQLQSLLLTYLMYKNVNLVLFY